MQYSKKLFWLLSSLLLLIIIAFLCWSFYPQPPGTLTHPWLIPQADQSDVGNTVSVSFSNLQKGGSGVASNGDPFVYIFDPDKGINLLAVFQASSTDTNLAQITFYQPEWAGITQMSNFLFKPFNAKILQRTNIDFMESVYISNCAYLYSTEKQEALKNEIIQLPFDRDFSGTQYYFGKVDRRNEPEDFWITVGDGLQMGLHGGTLDNCSETFANYVAIFMQIIDRFDLREKLGL